MYSTMTSKGQITIPKDIRDKLKLKSGDRGFWVIVGQHAEFWPKNLNLGDYAGMFHDPARVSMTTEDLNEAIGDAAAESGMSGLNQGGLKAAE